MSWHSRPRRPHHSTVVHKIVCQHRVEVEVWPSEAEVNFRDEAFVDPVNTQVRFHAVVLNATTGDVTWDVRSIDGSAGVGSIDPTGQYTAPPKGGLPHGTTDVVIATSVDDPMRQASAYVTLVGYGPEPPVPAKLEIFPRQVHLYYPGNQSAGIHNEYIDASNKRQLFRATIRNSDSTDVRWYVSTNAAYSLVEEPEPYYLYEASGSGPDGKVVRVKAELKDDAQVSDEVYVILINYRWPGIP